MKLGEAEQVYLVHGASEGCRSDGRDCCDYRVLSMETGVIGNANGSARVRLGNTDILVGVKAEVEQPALDAPGEGVLRFFVDCSANATPAFEGRGGDEIALTLTSALQQCINSSVLDTRKLCIVSREHCWVLYIDVLVLEMGGNLYDAVGCAVKAALSDVELPELVVNKNETGKYDVDVKDEMGECWKLDVSRVPLFVAVGKIGKSNVVDMTLEEESVSLCTLVVGVVGEQPGRTQQIAWMRLEGRGSLEPESLVEMCSLALKVGGELQETLRGSLRLEEEREAHFIQMNKGFGVVKKGFLW